MQEPKTWVTCLLLLVGLTIAGPTEAKTNNTDADPNTHYGLFIGNSYCDFYVIPDQVEAMIEGADFRRQTQGGFSLEKHWAAGRAQERIADEAEWDLIVLQNHSRSSLDHRDSFDEFGETFIDYIRANSDAEIYLYLTWARKKLPEDQDTITEAYCTLAVEKGVKVVPVGVAFASWIKAHPDVDILRDDNASHPNELGAYLSACVFYATITGESPVGQPARIEGYNWLTKGDTLVDLDEATARQLQQHAWETVQQFDPAQYAAVPTVGKAE